MRGSHAEGTGVKLDNGQVLLVGGPYYRFDFLGIHTQTGPLRTQFEDERYSDLFTPATGAFDLSNWDAANNRWQFTPNCFRTQYGSAALALENGTVLMTGGYVPPVADYTNPCTGLPADGATYAACVKNEARVFSTASGLADLAPMTTPRSHHTMTRLPDGKVLIVGGYSAVSFTPNPPGPTFEANPILTSTDTAEIYDPATGTFTPTAGRLSEPRSGHAAILLPTGKVMIVGGINEIGNASFSWPRTIEVYDAESGTFSVMDHLEFGLSAPLLAIMGDGNVFVAGQIQAPVNLSTTTSQSFKRPTGNNMANSIWTIGFAMLGTIAMPHEFVVKVQFDKYWPGQAQTLHTSPPRDRYEFDFTKRGLIQPAPFVQVRMEDDAGNVVAKQFTDQDGKAHFPMYDTNKRPTFLLEPKGKRYKVKAVSEYEIKSGGAIWVQGRIYGSDPTVPYESLPITYDAPGAPVDPGDATIGKEKTINLYGSNPIGIDPNGGQRIAGAFNIVWMLHQSFNLLRSVEPAACNTATLNIHWDPNLSDDQSFFRNETPYFAFINGSRAVNSDEYDDSVLGHEFGHFVNRLYGMDLNPSGTHDPSQYTYDPCLAFSEGWGNFFQAMVRSQTSYPRKSAIYFDTGKNGGKGLITPIMDPDASWPSKFTSSRGGGNELSVFRLLWEMHKNPQIFNGDFSKTWAVMKSYAAPPPPIPVTWIPEPTTAYSWVQKARLQPGVNGAVLNALLQSEGFSETPEVPYDTPLVVPLGVATNPQSLLGYFKSQGPVQKTTAYYQVTKPVGAPGNAALLEVTSTDALGSLVVKVFASDVKEGYSAAPEGGGKYSLYLAPGQTALIRLENQGGTPINYSLKLSGVTR